MLVMSRSQSSGASTPPQGTRVRRREDKGHKDGSAGVIVSQELRVDLQHGARCVIEPTADCHPPRLEGVGMFPAEITTQGPLRARPRDGKRQLKLAAASSSQMATVPEILPTILSQRSHHPALSKPSSVMECLYLWWSSCHVGASPCSCCLWCNLAMFCHYLCNPLALLSSVFRLATLLPLSLSLSSAMSAISSSI